MRYYLNGKQAQLIDKYTQDVIGIPGIVLMERAALKLAERIDEACKKIKGFDKKRDKILAVAESGNNGGDAVAAARLLKCMGYDTYVYEINGISKKSVSYNIQTGIALHNSVTFIGQEEKTENALYELFSTCRVVIDGIFGVGLSRDVSGIHKQVIDALNRASADKDILVVGCDIPSGICSNTGRILGAAVKCDITVTFGYIKYGMLVGEGRAYSGQIFNEDIGLYRSASLSGMADVLSAEDSPYLYYEDEESDIAGHIPAKRPDQNKGGGGKVLIVAGSEDIYGALYMCAESCFRCGCGLVKVVSHIRNRDLLMDKLPEAMMLTYDNDTSEDEFDKKYKDAIGWADVILAGPGLGCTERTGHLMDMLIQNCRGGQSVVFDADALNIISASDTEAVFTALRNRLGYEHVIITPHMGEMLRLLKGSMSMDELKMNMAEAATGFAQKYGIICILKDARTAVACTGKLGRKIPVYLNTAGNAGMAKGGSGDVLAGIVAGIIARNTEDEKTDYEMCCAAVHIHGRAGDSARDEKGMDNMLARDIIDNISIIK